MSLRPSPERQRYLAKSRRADERGFFHSPLMRFGEHAMAGKPAPRELAVETFGYIERRLIDCAGKAQSHKVRATTKWLSRWQEIVARFL